MLAAQSLVRSSGVGGGGQSRILKIIATHTFANAVAVAISLSQSDLEQGEDPTSKPWHVRNTQHSGVAALSRR